MLERVDAAARAGLDHLSFGDKHAVGADGLYVQGVPFLARALAEWPRDRSAGLLFLVPLWPPVLMAELIGTLASLTDAPLIVQTGIGGGQTQFGAMGASLKTRGRETDRRIDAVQRLLAGETVTDAALGMTNAAIGPRPTAPVEWWIGSGNAPAAIERAARLGALYLSPGWEIDAVADLAASYRERCAELGTTARVVCRRDVILADRHDDASELADDVIEAGYRGMSRKALLVGDVESAIDHVQALASVGVDDVVARIASVSREQAIRSIELLGDVRAGL